MALRTELDQISARTEAAVDNLFTLRQSGQVDEERFTKAAAAVVDKNNAQAVANANREVAIRKALAEKQAAVRPLGDRPFSDRARLEGAVKQTATKDDGSPEDDETRRLRLRRLGRSEPYSSAQDAMPKAMSAQGAKGWKRQTNPKACRLCRHWDDGKIRPPSMRMLRHPGCSCIQQPVFRGKVTQKERDFDRRDVDRLKRFGKLAGIGGGAAGAAVVAARVATQGRSSLLAGGIRAYRRLMELERAAENGGPLEARIRERISEGFVGRIADFLGFDPFDVDLSILRDHAASHERERIRGTHRSPCWKNRHIDFVFHRWLPAALQEKYPETAQALLKTSPRWGERATGVAGGESLPEMKRLGRLERQMAVLDGRFIHPDDAQAFLDNLAKNDYTPEEIEALWEYAGLHVDPEDPRRVIKGPVARFHHPLRLGILPPEETRIVELVDQAIAKNVTPRDITVFRGAELRDEFFEEWDAANEPLVDQSYLFTGLTEGRALPHATQRARYPHHKPVLFEIELPKGSPAISSPYGIGLGEKSLVGRKVPLPGGMFRAAIPGVKIPGIPDVVNVRVPFLRYFNKEELVLPRDMPLHFLSSRAREDGRRVVRVMAPKPSGATRTDRVRYFERLINQTPEAERESIVARVMEIYSHPDFTDLEEIEDVTVAWQKIQSGAKLIKVRRDLDVAIAAKRREIAQAKKRYRLARKEAIARHPSGGSQTAAHQTEMDALMEDLHTLVEDLQEMQKARRETDRPPAPTG